jgi:succinate dehydrogenase / fumarate reductase cytochrome b subunit
MSANSSFLMSSIGKKYLMAITAIAWSLFIMLHMLGNLFIFVGEEAYNKYSHALTSNPVIYFVEFLLIVLLLTHAFTGTFLFIKNRSSKPKLYAVASVKAKSPSFLSRTMIYSGLAVLAFILWHLITFKWGPMYFVNYNGIEMRDIYKLVVEKFHDPFYVAMYCFIMILIGMHLHHGIQSVFQTLGISHPRYNSFFKYFGYTYATVVSVGFFSQPLYVFFLR